MDIYHNAWLVIGVLKVYGSPRYSTSACQRPSPEQGSTSGQDTMRTTNTFRNDWRNMIAFTEYMVDGTGLTPGKPKSIPGHRFQVTRDNLRHPFSTSRHVIWWHFNVEADRRVFRVISWSLTKPKSPALESL